MSNSDLISLGAAFIAFISLGVSIWQSLQNKPRLRIGVQTDIMIYQDGPKEGPFIVISVVNCGAQPTTISNFGVEAFSNIIEKMRRRPKYTAVIYPGGYSSRLPYSLPPGAEAKCFAIQDAETLADFLKCKWRYVWVGDTWHSRAKRKRIAKSDVVSIAAQKVS